MNRAGGWLCAFLCVLVGMLSTWGATLPTEAPRDSSQKYLIRRWQSDDGYPQDSATAIYQTRDGYLWFGTWRGLVRYNGETFRLYEPGATSPALNRAVLGLYSDRSGTLWTAHMDASLARFVNERFEPVALPGRDGQRNGITGFGETLDGELILGTHLGLCRWKDGKATFVEDIQGLPKSRLIALTENKAGDLWCFFREPRGIGVIRNKRFIPAQDAARLDSFWITGTQLRPDGTIWIVGERDRNAIQAVMTPDGRISEPSPFVWGSGGAAWVIQCDTKGWLWLGSNGEGLRRVAPDGSYERITVKDGLSSDMVRAVFEDREGNIWVGTDGGGVNQIRPRGLFHYGREAGLQSEIVYSVAASPKEGVLVASHGGGVFELADGTFRQTAWPWKWPGYAWSVFVDSRTNIWAGSLMGDGIFRTKGNQLIGVGMMESIRAIAEDAKGTVWVGARKLVRSVGDRYEFVTDGVPVEKSITCFAPTPGGGMWLGSEGEGLFYHEDGTGRVRRIGVSDGLPDPRVNALHLDSTGALWIGTDDGLARLKKDRVSAIGVAQGLIPRSIRGIAEDGLGYLWLATGEGIARIMKADLDAVADGQREFFAGALFDKNDGMLTRECTTYTHPKIAKTRDGKMWFATLKGVVMVDPAQLVINTNPPPVLIEHVLLDGEPVNLGSGGELSVEVPAGVQRVEVQYAGLSFTVPDKVRFRHRMIGLHERWSESVGARKVSFERLPPGAYSFVVTAANSDGVWNPTGTRLGIRVLPQLWQTRTFVVVAFGLGIGLVAFVARWVALRRIRRELVRLEQVAAVERERNRIARDMHDDLGARLTKIAFFGELAERAAGDAVKSGEHLQAVARMSREAAQSLNEMVWAVKPSNDTLANLVSYLCQYATEYFEPTSIRLRFDLPRHPPEVLLSAETRHNVFLLVKEAMNNIVKHSEATEVWLRLHPSPDSFRVMVSDNGVGLATEGGGKPGNGLSNMRQRAKDMGGTVTFERPETGGLVVSLAVPLRPRGVGSRKG